MLFETEINCDNCFHKSVVVLESQYNEKGIRVGHKPTGKLICNLGDVDESECIDLEIKPYWKPSDINFCSGCPHADLYEDYGGERTSQYCSEFISEPCYMRNPYFRNIKFFSWIDEDE